MELKNGVDFQDIKLFWPRWGKICKRCDACLLRKKGFEEVWIEDPLWRKWLLYKIKEIFKSIQGEGYHVGRKAVFVRFTGCNYGMEILIWEKKLYVIFVIQILLELKV